MIEQLVQPLVERLPLADAMPKLVGADPKHVELVTEILRNPEIHGRPELAAGLWLYVDDLDRSHSVSQGIDTATGAFWHGIMHRREGDFSNCLYWMRRAAGHPLLRGSDALDAAGLVQAVEAAGGEDIPELVERQRAEWSALFDWCVKSSA
jgi:hypothetical protein